MAVKPKKQFNFMKASELPAREYLPTGIPELDKIVKGFPINQVTEIFGLEKVGKTTVTLMALAALTQQKGKKVIFIDVENSFNQDRAIALGVNLDNLLIAREYIMEDVAQLILDHVNTAVAIVVDSLPALIPRREAAGEFGDANIGIKAKVINELQRRVTPNLANSGCALIFINQLRPNMDPYGAKYIVPGGYATRYAAALRLELKANAADKLFKMVDKVKVRTGHTVHVTVVKTKNGGYEGKEIEFNILYNSSVKNK